MPKRRLSGGLAVAALAFPSPLISGDFPDPTAVRTDEGDYVALTSSGPWAPSLRVLRSPDLQRWRISSAVFFTTPRWVQKNFWAPEITRMGSGYAVFYSALPRRRGGWFCLGVATAATPEGPWRDLGRPLRCGKNGSIDPFPVRDEGGQLQLLWKADGNNFDRPTPIFTQRLREDGRGLLGRPRELIRNDRRWEGPVVEAPTVIRGPDGFFYMLYSGNLCCTRRCAYAVGVARSARIIGPWRKFPGNPILRGGNGWRCPGHTGFVDDGQGGVVALYHAFRAGDLFAGRQMLAAPVSFRLDGWPVIGDGHPPAAAPGAPGGSFRDDFAGSQLDTAWEHPLQRVPRVRTGDGVRLRAAARERGKGRARPRVDGAVLSRRVSSSSYTATTVLDRATLRGGRTGGLASYYDAVDWMGVSAGSRSVTVWKRDGGRLRRLATAPTPASGPVHLRMVARGRRFSFGVGSDGAAWRPVGPAARGPFGDSGRLALIAGGPRLAEVRFVSAALEELEQP